MREAKADELYVKIIPFSDVAANRERPPVPRDFGTITKSSTIVRSFFFPRSSSVIVARGQLRYIKRDSISRQGYS